MAAPGIRHCSSAPLRQASPPSPVTNERQDARSDLNKNRHLGFTPFSEPKGTDREGWERDNGGIGVEGGWDGPLHERGGGETGEGPLRERGGGIG